MRAGASRYDGSGPDGGGRGRGRGRDRHGPADEGSESSPVEVDTSNPYLLHQGDEGRRRDEYGDENDGLMRLNASESGDDSIADDDDEEDDDSDASEDEYGMSIQELLYSSSSYYAIAKPVVLTMVLAALAAVVVTSDQTRNDFGQAMSSAYLTWDIDESSGSTGKNLAVSLANALVMVTVLCGITFFIVLLYYWRFMKCLIGYMIVCSCGLLGTLGGNLIQTAIAVYRLPIDNFTFYFFVYNFSLVGVLSIFWGEGIPKFVTQGYLIATSVILAWHLNFFDDWTTWTLLFMLAVYDLCAVLTPCGPLRALVNLMSKEDSPEMPGLLFEADLPADVKRPGVPNSQSGISQASGTTPRLPSSSGQVNSSNYPGSPTSNDTVPGSDNDDNHSGIVDRRGGVGTTSTAAANIVRTEPGPKANIPLAIARVYSLPVVGIPAVSMRIMYPQRFSDPAVAAEPLLQEQGEDVAGMLPENPTAQQLRANVTVRLPPHGGRLEQVSRRGKKVFLERDRHGQPKRILWVDRNGKVFAEMRGDDEDGPERNSIRLGLGDFIFYSVLVAKAAQYSFATFAACTLVILAGLGGTLVLLSVYHHALPALPISIFLGVVFYLFTRYLIEPWIEAVLNKPYYV